MSAPEDYASTTPQNRGRSIFTSAARLLAYLDRNDPEFMVRGELAHLERSIERFKESLGEVSQ